MRKSRIYYFEKDYIQKLMNESTSLCMVVKKLGFSGNSSKHTLKKIIQEYGLDDSQMKQNQRDMIINRNHISRLKNSIKDDDVFKENSIHATSVAKRRLFQKHIKEYKCEICGISEWNGKKITLQLHHLNGISNDHRIENLQVLCPNCHSQTENFSGANNNKYIISTCVECGKQFTQKDKTRKNLYCSDLCRNKQFRKVNRPNKDELLNLIKCKTFVEIGKMYGVSDNSIRKWCKIYGLPYRKKDIKMLI